MTALFDESFLRKLERLSLVVRRRRAGQTRGERRSTKRGTSVEFADYRNYAPGDDLRHLDWNIYARLERPFIKLFEEEEDLAVHIVIDASRSMDWGESADNKFAYARRVAAALGYVALAAGDRLTVAAVGDGRVVHASPPLRGRVQLHRLLALLESLPAQGTTDLDGALREYALAARRPGLLFLISDLFSPGGYRSGLSDLQGRGYEVNLLHLLAPEEVEPALAGDLRLHDVETGQAQEVTVDGAMRRLYRRHLDAWRGEIETFCLGRGINYVAVETSLPFDALILTHLRRRGMVR
jgi:uncharacterized protein (DUF58 family)